jgi:vacuolar-type H+-ATPase subunit I/STV1
MGYDKNSRLIFTLILVIVESIMDQQQPQPETDSISADQISDTASITEAPDSTANQLMNDGEMTPAGMILELEQVIKNHITGINTRREELKKFKEMVSDAFKNDATYQEVEEAYKKATKVKKEIKFSIMKQPGVNEAADKLRELSTEIKELDGALSDYLREYQRLAGVNEIQDNEGNVHEIVYLAKLLKKGTNKK